MLGTQDADGNWEKYVPSEGEISVDDGVNKYVATGDAPVVEPITLTAGQTVVENTANTITSVDANGNIVEVTTADVKSFVESHSEEEDGFVKTFDWVWHEGLLIDYPVWEEVASAHDNARAAAEKRKAELIAQGYENVNYTLSDGRVWDGDWPSVYYYMTYDEYDIATTTLETKTYSASKYEPHTFVVGSHTEYGTDTVSCWTERKDTSNDAIIKAAMDKITALTESINNKKAAADEAQAAVEDAREAAEAAKAALDAVKSDLSSTAAEVAAARTRYTDATTILTEAEGELAEIEQAVSDAEDDLQTAQDELERFVVYDTPSTGDEGGDAGTGGAGTAPAVVNLVAEPTPLAATPTVAGGATAGAGAAGAGDGDVTIEDGDTPLADGIGGDDVIVAEPEEEIEETLVEIEDEETPLAPSAEEKDIPSEYHILN